MVKHLFILLTCLFSVLSVGCTKKTDQQINDARKTAQTINPYNNVSQKTLKQNSFNLQTIDGQMYYLLNLHQKSLHKIFQNMKDDMDRFNHFDRGFFTHIDFLNESSSNQFFQTIQNRIESGQAPQTGGMLMISYTSFTSINGVEKAVHYEYKSDGQNISLLKQANNNGQIVKAFYQYDMKGKLLNVKEYKDNQLVNQGDYKIEI